MEIFGSDAEEKINFKDKATILGMPIKNTSFSLFCVTFVAQTEFVVFFCAQNISQKFLFYKRRRFDV